jgi:hypothetical protein
MNISKQKKLKYKFCLKNAFLLKKFSTFGDRNGSCDRYEFTFYTIKNNEKSFKYAGKVS